MLLIYDEFAFEVDQLTIFLHGSHDRAHYLVKVLVALYLVNKAEWSIDLVH